MALERQSFCKVNLLLNILGKRSDGFHEVETFMQPMAIFDRLSIAFAGSGIALTCSNPALPTDAKNLVFRAAEAFIKQAGIKEGVRIHLEKRIPLAAGLGGGSGNAAATLLALNELFGNPVSTTDLQIIAESLGSDVPFFLQSNPALATGRGEVISPLKPFPALQSAAFVLIHPGFGISTPWAYQQLQHFPDELNGRRGRARELISLLENGSDLRTAGSQFYNSLEAPALKKYPLLVMFQEFMRDNGALATLMSGSGSTTFGVIANVREAEGLAEKMKGKFGTTHWLSVVPGNGI